MYNNDFQSPINKGPTPLNLSAMTTIKFCFTNSLHGRFMYNNSLHKTPLFKYNYSLTKYIKSYPAGNFYKTFYKQKQTNLFIFEITFQSIVCCCTVNILQSKVLTLNHFCK